MGYFIMFVVFTVSPLRRRTTKILLKGQRERELKDLIYVCRKVHLLVDGVLNKLL